MDVGCEPFDQHVHADCNGDGSGLSVQPGGGHRTRDFPSIVVGYEWDATHLLRGFGSYRDAGAIGAGYGVARPQPYRCSDPGTAESGAENGASDPGWQG